MKAPPTSLQSDLFAVLIIAAVSLGAGLLLNLLREEPLALVYQSQEQRVMAAADVLATEARSSGAPTEVLRGDVGLEEFRRLVEARDVVVLDARPEGLHRIGRVPGALSLPLKDFKAAYTRLAAYLESDKARPIVLYCGGTSCEDSDLVRRALHRLGYTHVSVFRGGWAAWTEAGLPKERNP